MERYKVLQTISNALFDNAMIRKNASGGGNLTFFTPTFNRCKFLPRIYDCLLKQTCKDFVWIVVDDGSSDGTAAVMERIVSENKIPVKYLQKVNGGKHSAFKVALDNCFTPYFQCMDDDDIYAVNSVEFFLNEWKKIKEQGCNNIGAIRTLTVKKDGSIVSNFAIPDEDMGKEFDASTLEMNYVLHKRMENWTCYETEKLRSIDLFPTDYWMYSEHKFYSEGLWQGRFARKYECRYVNVALRTYCDDAPTNLTSKKVKSRQRYVDMFLNEKMINDEQLDYRKRNPKDLIKSVIIVDILSGYLGISVKELCRHTPSRLLKMAYVTASPVRLFSNVIMKSRN